MPPANRQPLLHTTQVRYIVRALQILMPPTKTATLNLRIDPAVKEAVQAAAARDRRSVANLIELLIRKHCRKVGIPVPTQAELFAARERRDG